MRKYSLNCVVGRGGGGEILKGGRAGRARSLGFWPRGASSRGAKSLGHRNHRRDMYLSQYKGINYLLF